MGVGYGRFAGYPDAEPASWLLERGLLLPVTYSQLVVPREAALGLRGGLVFPSWPEPPAAEVLDPLRDGPARAAAAATRAVVAAEGICARLDREPLPLVRAGTVAVRDLGRLARDLDLSDEELALLVDLLVEAGFLAVGGPSASAPWACVPRPTPGCRPPRPPLGRPGHRLALRRPGRRGPSADARPAVPGRIRPRPSRPTPP